MRTWHQWGCRGNTAPPLPHPTLQPFPNSVRPQVSDFNSANVNSAFFCLFRPQFHQILILPTAVPTHICRALGRAGRGVRGGRGDGEGVHLTKSTPRFKKKKKKECKKKKSLDRNYMVFNQIFT